VELNWVWVRRIIIWKFEGLAGFFFKKNEGFSESFNCFLAFIFC